MPVQWRWPLFRVCKSKLKNAKRNQLHTGGTGIFGFVWWGTKEIVSPHRLLILFTTFAYKYIFADFFAPSRARVLIDARASYVTYAISCAQSNELQIIRERVTCLFQSTFFEHSLKAGCRWEFYNLVASRLNTTDSDSRFLFATRFSRVHVF